MTYFAGSRYEETLTVEVEIPELLRQVTDVVDGEAFNMPIVSQQPSDDIRQRGNPPLCRQIDCALS